MVTVTLAEQLEKEITTFFKSAWQRRDGQKVPDADDVALYNVGVDLDATILYADLAESTQLVRRKRDTFAAEVYKAFLYSSARIIEARGGVVTAYDGDRVMGVFIGNGKNSAAARAALTINYAAKKLVMPALKKSYPKSDYVLRHCVGIDTSKVMVARTGVRGANDLVWVGRAANYAAKMSALRLGCPTIISESVYFALNKRATYSKGIDMWKPIEIDDPPVDTQLYGSTYWWIP